MDKLRIVKSICQQVQIWLLTNKSMKDITHLKCWMSDAQLAN